MSNSDDKASITQSKEEPNYAVYAESVASPADIEVDAVFGERKEGGVDYRSVGWYVNHRISMWCTDFGPL